MSFLDDLQAVNALPKVKKLVVIKERLKCIDCNKYKDANDFSWKGSSKKYRKSYCKACAVLRNALSRMREKFERERKRKEDGRL